MTPLTWELNVLNLLYCGYFYFFWLLWHRIFCTTLQDSMQHAAFTFDAFNIPWILHNLLFPLTSFWQESLFNISNHWPDSWPELICINGLSDLVNPLISANSCPRWHNYSLWGLLFQFPGQLALKFHWVKMCLYFELLLTPLTLHLNWSVMQKPV